MNEEDSEVSGSEMELRIDFGGEMAVESTHFAQLLILNYRSLSFFHSS